MGLNSQIGRPVDAGARAGRVSVVPLLVACRPALDRCEQALFGVSATGMATLGGSELEQRPAMVTVRPGTEAGT